MYFSVILVDLTVQIFIFSPIVKVSWAYDLVVVKIYADPSSYRISQHISLLLHYNNHYRAFGANPTSIGIWWQLPPLLHWQVWQSPQVLHCQQPPQASMAFVDKFHKIPPALLWLAMNWSLSLWFVLMNDVFIPRWIQNLGEWEPGNEAKFKCPWQACYCSKEDLDIQSRSLLRWPQLYIRSLYELSRWGSDGTLFMQV